MFQGSLRLPSHLGDVLHDSTHWVPFCWVINNKVLPEVTEQLPGENRWGSLEEPPRQAAPALPGPARAEQPHQQDRDTGCRAALRDKLWGQGDPEPVAGLRSRALLPCQPLGVGHNEADAMGMAEVSDTELLLQR